HLGLVRDLIALAQSSGARHLGALLQAVEPDSELAPVLAAAAADMMAQEDLPDPQTEWNDALRRIELDALKAEQAALIRAGVPDEQARAHYQELTQRIAILNSAGIR